MHSKQILRGKQITHHTRTSFRVLLAVASFCAAQMCVAQARPAAQSDSSVVSSNGTVYVTRIVPVPTTISPEAQKMLAAQVSDAARPQTLAERRAGTDAWQSRAGEAFRALYPVNVAAQTIAGVPTKVVTPLSIPEAKRNRVLINLHGGGLNSDSGSLTESVPIANISQTKVVAVLYRLAPENPYPAAVSDVVAVYRELLKTYKPQNIGIYGTSAGAVLTAEVAVKLHQLGLPLPAALGIFSGMGDFSLQGDSESLYALQGFSGHLDPPSPNSAHLGEYVGTVDPKDPLLSPIYADLRGLPPTLFITSGRDMLLSGTILLHRAFLRAGVDGRLVVFEALPHAFWNDQTLPESSEAHHMMADFFDRELGR